MYIRKLLALSLIASVCYVSLQFASRPPELPQLPLTPPMQKALTDMIEATKTKSPDDVIALIEKMGKQEGTDLQSLITRPDKSGKTLFEYVSEMKNFDKYQDRLAQAISAIDVDISLQVKNGLNQALKDAHDIIKGDIAKGEAYLKSNINQKIADLAHTSQNLTNNVNNINEIFKKGEFSKIPLKTLLEFYKAAIIFQKTLHVVDNFITVFD